MKTIAILEDDPIWRSKTASLLSEQLSMEAAQFSSCLELKTWLDAGHEPDFVVLDVHLPDGNSDVFEPLLRKKRIPFVVVTGGQAADYGGQTNPEMYVSKTTLEDTVYSIGLAVSNAFNKKNMERKIDGDQFISVAVGIIMARYFINHDQAYTVLRTSARNLRLSLKDCARSLIDEIDGAIAENVDTALQDVQSSLKKIVATNEK